MKQVTLDHLIRCLSGAWGGTYIDRSSAHRRTHRTSTALITLCLLALATAQGFARPKLSPELKHAKPGQAVNVIVQFTSNPTEHHIGKVTGKGAALKEK